MSAFGASCRANHAAVRHAAGCETGSARPRRSAAAYVYTRDLHTYPNFDEGNYLGSMDALRHGQSLGRDVFLDQPPGWYLLLVAVSYPFGNSVSGVRTGLMVVDAPRDSRRVRVRAGSSAGLSRASWPLR